MRNRRPDARHIADLAQFTTRNSNPELDYDGVGNELAGTAPPSLSQSRNASSSTGSKKGRSPNTNPGCAGWADRTSLGSRWIESFERGACFWPGCNIHYYLTCVAESLVRNRELELAIQFTGQRMLRPTCSTIFT
jgi:hypothetical protein